MILGLSKSWLSTVDREQPPSPPSFFAYNQGKLINIVSHEICFPIDGFNMPNMIVEASLLNLIVLINHIL